MSELIEKSGIILIICLILQSSALSAEFAGGTGEPNDPYQIATAEQLISIGADRDLLDKHFILIEDIDLDPNLPGGRIFEDALIAQDEDDSANGHKGSSFNGIFDGNGHTIANLHIEGKYGYDTGLFGMLSGLIKNLHLTDVVVSGSTCGAMAGLHHGTIFRCRVNGRVSGAKNVGGLVGNNSNGSLIECEAQVQVVGDSSVGGMVGGGPGGTLSRCEVQAEVNGNNIVGGLVGRQSGHSIIECRVAGVVSGNSTVGGLIGEFYETLIWRSSVNCVVTAEQTAGGLIGFASGIHMFIADCYARGSITGSTLGGLIGETHGIRIINCYAACEVYPLEVEGTEARVGGLFGNALIQQWSPTTIACFWDAESSGITVSTGSDPHLELGQGLSTEQMLDEEMFRNAGWDFDYIWMISEGEYPKLRWEVIKNDAVATP